MTTMPPKLTWSEARRGFRHKTIMHLRDMGFSHREAQKLVACVFEEMKNSLARGEDVCLDWGTLQRVRADDPVRTWRFGKITTLNQAPYRIVFIPKENL